jgi:hypothetical protein
MKMVVKRYQIVVDVEVSEDFDDSELYVCTVEEDMLGDIFPLFKSDNFRVVEYIETQEIDDER